MKSENERRIFILMMHHNPDMGTASDWLKQISHEAQPVRSTIQIGRSRTYLKDCFWLAGKTIGIVT